MGPSRRSVPVVQPVEVNDLDVVAVCHLDEQLVIARADQEQSCLGRTGAELAARFDEPIEMAAADPITRLGLADRGDGPAGRSGWSPVTTRSSSHSRPREVSRDGPTCARSPGTVPSEANRSTKVRACCSKAGPRTWLSKTSVRCSCHSPCRSSAASSRIRRRHSHVAPSSSAPASTSRRSSWFRSVGVGRQRRRVARV
jgi:hypothetical protein